MFLRILSREKTINPFSVLRGVFLFSTFFSWPAMIYAVHKGVNKDSDIMALIVLASVINIFFVFWLSMELGIGYAFDKALVKIYNFIRPIVLSKAARFFYKGLRLCMKPVVWFAIGSYILFDKLDKNYSVEKKNKKIPEAKVHERR